MQIAGYTYIKNLWSSEFDASLDSKNTMILIFFESTLNISGPLEKIKKNYPLSQILGCSTSGEIYKSNILENSLAMSVVKFEKTQIKMTHMTLQTENSKLVGQALVDNLYAPDLKSIILFTEGLDSDGSLLIRTASQALVDKNTQVPITGGLASDGDRFKNTFIIYDDQCKKNHAVALGLYGEHIKAFPGTGGGWDPFGPIRKVTKSIRNKIYEFDHIPSLQLYKEYLKDDAKNLPYSGILFPMAISWGKDENIVRSILSFNEEENSITFAGSFAENARVQLMHSNLTKLIQGAGQAVKNSKHQLNAEINSFTLIVSCFGRKAVMGQKTEDELDVIKDNLPFNTEIHGFYSYGEFSPVNEQLSELHNQTMTLIIFQEI